jgi:hypothetical protein
VFDTPDRGLRQARHSLRLREEAGRFILTAKGPSLGVSGNVSARPEAEAEVEPEVAQRILAGQGDVMSELRRRATDPAYAALWEGIERAHAGQPLGEVAFFHNRRRAVDVTIGGVPLRVEVDHTSFPNGDADDEVEIEIPRPELAPAVEAWLEERAAAASVQTAKSTTKLARFYAALGEPDR